MFSGTLCLLNIDVFKTIKTIMGSKLLSKWDKIFVYVYYFYNDYND